MEELGKSIRYESAKRIPELFHPTWDFTCCVCLGLNFAFSSALTMWSQCCDLSLAAEFLCARVPHPPSDELLVTQRTAWNKLCFSQTWLWPSIFSWSWLTPIYAAFHRGISSQRKQEDNEEMGLLMTAEASHKFPMFSPFVALFILAGLSHNKVTSGLKVWWGGEGSP